MVRGRAIAIPFPQPHNVDGRVFSREKAPVAILAVGSKKVCLSDMDRDEQLPSSVRLAMCPSERERDPASCQASGMPIGPNSSELPVQVVLILPLLVPPLHASSSGTGTGGATSTPSPLLFLGLASEVSSRLRPLWWLRKSPGFYSCRPPHCPVDASSLVFSFVYIINSIAESTQP